MGNLTLGRILAAAGSSSTVLNLPSSFAPATNTLIGATLEAITGTNAGTSRTITANSTTTITTAAFGGAPSASDVFAIPGVLDAPSETRSPWHRRSIQFGVPWAQTRSGRSRRNNFPIPRMATPARLVLQHTTQIGVGIVPTYQAVNIQGDSFLNSPNATLQFFNNTSGPFLVTVQAQSTCNQGYLHNYTMAVQPGQALPTLIGPFDIHYNDSSNVVHVYYTWGNGIQLGVTVALVGP